MLSDYKIIRKIGCGGFGKVFLAKEKISKRLVAIKCLLEKDEKRQNSILHEIRTIAKLSHPNVIIYHHSFREENVVYLVMEYCKGGSLRQFVKNVIEFQKTLEYVKIISSTMEYVHSKGIVHHDIKPDNILIDNNNNIKITDFGIANKLAGTRSYMAPEMYNWNVSSTIDKRVDIYALGITLLELLTSNNPFYNLSKKEIISKHEKADFGIDDLPEWIQNIILKAIHRTPQLRFQTMKDFYEAISAKSVKNIVNNDNIEAGKIAANAARRLKRKRWRKIFEELKYTDKELYPNNANIKKVLGKYHIYFKNISKAEEYLEEAKKLNPRIDVQKELGQIYLEEEKYPAAISLLTDYIDLNPSDMQAHNLLLKCYYETGVYEVAVNYAKMLARLKKSDNCFVNNYYVCYALLKQKEYIIDIPQAYTSNPFVKYNASVLKDKDKSWGIEQGPSLKSKLLFQKFRFKNINKTNNKITVILNGSEHTFEKKIISFGRSNYNNDFEISNSVNISRKHFLIINYSNDVWLYNLSGLMTYVDDKRVKNKCFLNTVHKINIGNFEIIIKSNSDLVL